LLFLPHPNCARCVWFFVGWPCVFFAISRTVSGFFALWIFTRERARDDRAACGGFDWCGMGVGVPHAARTRTHNNDQRPTPRCSITSRPPPPWRERERERPFACARHKARYWKNPRTHVCIKTRRKQTQSVG
jgi:hypothetical protein